MDIVVLIIGSVATASVIFCLGAYRGKRRTMKLLGSLREDGSLTIQTRDQVQMQELLYEEPEEAANMEFSHNPRDSSDRRVKWAGAMRQNELLEEDEE